jgi:succinate dehydrogenase / fumarate reductase cytochrome b subunit
MATQTGQIFWLTTIGKKYFMGISGLIWAGFVFGHMAGNMLMFVSKDHYNAYGHALTSGMVIYLIEAVLLATLLGHVFFGFLLTYQNRKAKGTRYAASSSGAKATSLSSKTMIFQGSIILVFVISHLITFKYGAFYETTVNGVVMRDLHRLLTEVFQQPGYVFWYVVSLVLLGIHLSHGVGSTVQSLGLKTENNQHWVQLASWIYGAVVAIGFLSQPISIYLFKS